MPAHAHAVAAGLLARAGDLAGARMTLDVMLDLDTWRQDRSYLWSVFVGHMATAAVALQDLEVCETLVAELEPVASSCAVNGAVVAFGGSNALRVGTLLAALGRVNDVRGHLMLALGVHERLGGRSLCRAGAAPRIRRQLPEAGGPAGRGAGVQRDPRSAGGTAH